MSHHSNNSRVPHFLVSPENTELSAGVRCSSRLRHFSDLINQDIFSH